MKLLWTAVMTVSLLLAGGIIAMLCNRPSSAPAAAYSACVDAYRDRFVKDMLMNARLLEIDYEFGKPEQITARPPKECNYSMVTPNLGLLLPAYGSLNYDTCFMYDFRVIDAALREVSK